MSISRARAASAPNPPPDAASLEGVSHGEPQVAEFPDNDNAGAPAAHTRARSQVQGQATGGISDGQVPGEYAGQ